jgi:hypothetical protein
MKYRKTDQDISKEIGDLFESIALKTVRVETDETNFKILCMLPSNIETMMKDLSLTKVPINNRVNLLEKVCLVKRSKGTGKVVISDFGKFFLDKIKTYEDLVRENVASKLKSMRRVN